MSNDDLRDRMARRRTSEAKPVKDVLSGPGADMRRMTVYISAEDQRELKVYAAQHDTSMSAIISGLVRDLLEKDE